jgi:hypothetical protein
MKIQINDRLGNHIADLERSSVPRKGEEVFYKGLTFQIMNVIHNTSFDIKAHDVYITCDFAGVTTSKEVIFNNGVVSNEQMIDLFNQHLLLIEDQGDVINYLSKLLIVAKELDLENKGYEPESGAEWKVGGRVINLSAEIGSRAELGV